MKKYKLSQGWVVFLLILLLVIIDQAIKIFVKTHMVLGEEITITNWFRIYFIENPGMAFGITLGSKLFLTLFRIIAIGMACWVIAKIAKGAKQPFGMLLSMAAIVAGGLGNIFDSVFYGKIFSDSHGQVAKLFPADGGYGSWLHGKVVDMFYFPIIDSYFPQWMPFVGGEHFIFFSPIFNFADSCVCVGTFALILFYAKSTHKALSSIKLPHWLSKK